jgi:hypothetical protein
VLPTCGLGLEMVLVMPTSALCVTAFVSLALLLILTGSKTPAAAGSVVTVFVIEASKLSGDTLARTLKVAVPKGAKVTELAIGPVPDDTAQLDPAKALHVQLVNCMSPGSGSFTGNPATVNALLLLVIMIV